MVSVSCVCCANVACADKVRSREGIVPSFAENFNCYVAERLKMPATSGCDTASSSSVTFAVSVARRSRTVFEDASCCSSSGRSPRIRSCILVYEGISTQRLQQSRHRGCTLDSRMASSSSATHDAARSAFNVLTVAEEIFERIREEMS